MNLKTTITMIFIFLLSCQFTYAINAGLELDDSHFNVRSKNPQEIQILNDGYSALEKRLELIEKATKTIDVETFIWWSDDSGQLVAHALIKKARQGVKIRVLVDTFVGVKGFNYFIAHEMRKEGIEVKHYNPSPLYQVVEAQWRNHKKSLTIDSKETIIGGRNIGDEYFDLDTVYSFVDRDVWIKGDLVNAVDLSFESTWTSAESVEISRGKKPSKNDPQYRRSSRGSSRSLIKFKEALRVWNENVAFAKEFVSLKNENTVLREEIRNLALMQASGQTYGVCSRAQFVSDRPISHSTGRTARILKSEVFKRIKSTKRSLKLESPYFIVNKETDEILKAALKRGVETTLLTNYLYSTDAIYVSAALYSIANEWLRSGLNMFLHSGDIQADYQVINEEVRKSRWGTHGKSIVFDDESIMIGSFNFDPRSYNFSAELALFCEGNENLARALREDIEQRERGAINLQRSDLEKDPKAVKETLFHRVSFGKKMLYYILKGPSVLFDFML